VRESKKGLFTPLVPGSECSTERTPASKSVSFLCRSRDDRVACCGTCRYFEEFGDRTTIANVSEYVLRGGRYLSWSGSVVDDGI
jgi:hypothetical protein